MRKRVVIVMIGIFGVIASLILFRTLTNREPQYQGKRLSEWFKQYYRTGRRMDSSDNDRHGQAAHAFRALGTNAVPFLLTEFYSTSQNSRLQTNVLTLLSKLPRPFRFPAFIPARIIREEAANAISEVKPSSDFLLPLVTNRLYAPDKRQRHATIYLLCSLRFGANEVMPFLREMLRSTNGGEQLSAVVNLTQLGPAARPALLDLVDLVKREESDLRAVHAACRALGNFGDEAAEVVPALNARLAKEPRVTSRINFAKTLCQIDAQQTDALETILQHARDQTSSQRIYAIMSLGNIGPNAKAAVSTLLETAKEDEVDTWHSAANALMKIGETNLAISAVTEKLQQKDPLKRYNAVTFLLWAQPTNAAAMSNLVQFVQHPQWGGSAISDAAKLGRAAGPVIPYLRQIATNDTHRLRYAAQKALSDIEGAGAEERDAR